MSLMISKLTFRMSASLALALVAVVALLGSVLPMVSSSTQPAKKAADRTVVVGDDPYIKLQSRDLQMNYDGAGTMALSSAMRSGSIEPLALASSDFDGDGYPDLVCGYGAPGGGIIAVHRADKAAFAPEDPEVLKGIAQGDFPEPFIAEPRTFALPEAPDFVGAGDLNRDGKPDIILAARGGSVLYLLEGDGEGGFSFPQQILLQGSVTALIIGNINNQDGLADVIVGIDSISGSSLLVFEGAKSILETTPASRPVPARVTSLALGRLDEDRFEDLAILADGQILILHGHDSAGTSSPAVDGRAGTLETVPLPFAAKAMALGEFVWDRDSRTEIAALASDGVVHVVTRGELDTRPWTEAEVLEKRQDLARIREKMDKAAKRGQVWSPPASTVPEESRSWTVAEDLSYAGQDSMATAAAASDGGSSQPILLSTRLSSLPSDDLAIVNPGNHQIQLLYKQNPKEGDPQIASKSKEERSSVGFESAGEVTAVLPMRVNVDGRPGLVVMSKGKGSPTVFLPMAGATFHVTKTTDTNDGACNADCSLREAIVAANGDLGSDTIVFDVNGTFLLSITSGGAQENAAATGDLDINSSVVITGNGAANTVISTNYTNTCGDCKVFGLDQTGGFPGIAVSFTGVTIQNGFNKGIGTFFDTGGGIDFFLQNTGNVFSMTNCVVQNNTVTGSALSHGGGINVDSANQATPAGASAGTATFTGCTISGNSSGTFGGGVVLAADKHDATMTNCVVTGNSTTGVDAPGGDNTGGGIWVRHSFGGTVTINGASGSVSTNTAHTSGGGIAVVGNEVTNISNITINGNTASGVGGSSLGGGILIDTLGASGVTGSTTLTSVSVTNNHANNGTSAAGGGVWFGHFYPATLTTCTITGNTSKDGAGVMNGGSTATPAATLAISGGSMTGNAATGLGGGFAAVGTGTPSPSSVTTISNVTIGGTGAGLPNTAANGGGIANTQTSQTTVTGGTISGNTATTNGGGVLHSSTGTMALDGVTIDSNSASSGDGIHQSAGTFNNSNTINLSGGDSIVLTGGTFNSTSGTLNLTGNFTNSGGNFVHNSGTVIFNGTTAQSLGGSTLSTFNNLTVNKTGTLTLVGSANEAIANVAGGGNLSINSGIFDLGAFSINRAAAGGTLTVANGTTLKIGGTNTLPSNFSTHSIGATSTIEYSGTSQNVASLNSSQKYGNLVTSGSGTKTLAGNISIATSLTIGVGTTLDASVTNFSINDAGNWTNNGTFTPRSGTVTFDGTTGTQTLAGNTTFFNLTLNNSGATTAFGATSTTIGSNFVTTAGTMNGGTSTITFTGNPGSISGASTKNFNNLVINSGAVVSNTTGGNTNISNDYTNNGTFTQAAALSTTFNTGADGNHSFSGNGTTTFGIVTINSANTVDGGTHNFNVAGASFSVDGTFTGNAGTATFNGAVAQSILGNGNKNFAGLTINNAAGVTVTDTTPVVDATVSGLLTLTTDLTVAAGAILQQSGTSGGVADVIGTVRRTDLGVTTRAFGNPNVTIAIDSGTAPNPMDVTLTKASPGTFPTSVQRTYALTPTGGSGISATVKLHYLNAELNGNTEAKLGLWKDVAGTFLVQGRTGAVDTVNKAVTLSGVSSFSNWTLADMADVTVTVSPTSTLEDSGTPMVYTFTRTGPTTQSLLVNFSVGGTATPPGGPTPDYGQTGADTFTTTDGTVTIAVGSATATVNVTPTSDTVVEPDETVILTLTAGTYNIAAPSAATGTITNDDADVSVAVAPTSVTEDGAPNLVYTFTRAGATAGALTVNFSVGGTATFNTDYTQTGAATFTASSGTVAFGAGNSTATVTVDPTADNTVEPDETVILTVTAGTGYNVGTPSAATGTITNDDADVSVAVATSAGPGTTVLEDGATNLVYTFTRTGFTGAALTINFTVGGTATFSTDYTQTGAATFTTTTGTVTFTGTNTTATVTIDPSVDSTAEADETVILTVAAGTGYSPAAPTSATGTILNDDTQVSVSASPTSTDEDGATNMVYTFTRTGDTTAALSVNFSVGGTATFNTDYTQSGADTFTASTGTVTIGAGNATATVTIDPTADITVEPDETVILTVTAGTGYVPGVPASATGTILNDDTDVSVAVSPSSTAEDGATNLVYTFTRNGVTTGALTANFSVGGTATFSTDYTQTGAATFTATDGTVTFGAGNSTATVTVDPSADTTVEPDETVILTVTSGTGYSVGAPSSATGTISNDDTDVSLAVSPSTVFEDGATNLVYTFSRTGVTATPLTVNFSVGGTATFSTDYTQTGAATFTASTGTVTFGAGNSTATVTVDPSADLTPEADETVILMLTAGTGYAVINPDTATGTITNDDTDVSVTVSPLSVAEDGATNLVYTFTRVGITTGALTVNFSVGGTATFGTDYAQSGADTFTTTTGTVTIGAGNSTATVTLDPSPDLTVEPDETAILTVVAGAGYNPAAPTSATGTIVNDDTDVTVAVAPSSTPEDGAGNLVYTFTRTGVTTSSITVNFSVGGTATLGTDYTQTGADTFTASAGTVTIGVGNSTATVTVDPSTDSTVEPDETVILMVTAGTGYNIGAPDTATGTIANDDTDVTLTVSPSSVGEDGSTNLVYTFTRSGVTTSSLTVNFSVGGTATFTSDYGQTGAATYGASSGTVTITSGNTTATVSLAPVNDVKVEGSETAILTLTAGSYGIGTPSAATGTITDNDTATVAFAVSSSNAPEQTTPHNVGVTLVITADGAGTPMLERTVSANVQDLGTGTATGGGTDYTYSPNPQTVTFNSGDIAQTKNVSITIVNDSLSEGNETINFQLNTLVDGTGGQVSLIAPTSDVVTIVDNDIDLKVTKTESADPVAAGGGTGNLVYTVKVKNVGLTAATGVTMSESLTVPAGVTIDSVMVSAGSTSGSNPYTWNIGNLGVNVEVTLTATLTVGAGAAAGTNVICDTAMITASTENRVNTGDDSVTECTSIVAQADLEISSKTDAPDPVCVGGTITYTISFQNNGPGPGLSTLVRDAVPANTTFVSAMVTSGMGWTTTSPAVGGTGNVDFTKASVANGETATFQVVVLVSAGTIHGTVISNTATASSTLLDPTPANNSKQAMTTVDPNAPTLSCPANVTGFTNPNVCAQGGCATVNFATPTAMDDCPGVQVVCVPPSGSCMPTGSTMVTCTATDTAGNMASCSFAVTVFDVCLQDESNPNTVLLFNSQTGAYKFCCAGTTYTGTGTVSVRGCMITLTHNVGDRRVSASIDKTQFKGTASLQSPPGVMKCTIIDKDTRNNSCNCP